MNYIVSQLNRKINLLKGLGKTIELKTHYQAKLEFYLVFILAYLWNENFEKVSEEDKTKVVETILKPSIGSIISASRILDINSEIFGNKNLKKFISAINEYPKVRNEKIGHGFAYEDSVDNYLDIFEDLIAKIEEAKENILNKPNDLILVHSLENDVYSGICFKSNGADYTAWSCPKAVHEFTVDSLYFSDESNNYLRLSPFVYIENENDFFIFSSIEEKLTGRVKFNQLIRTGKKYIEFPELASIDIINDGYKRKTPNGTIVNHYSINYVKYIDIGFTNRIINFLTKNNSSVFATLWGHGGIGKTAAIQNACEILANQERKKFDYIIFLSAKDRYYNYYKGVIQEVKGSLKSLNEIIEFSSNIIYSNTAASEDDIIKYEGQLLMVIDDFETFSKDEKSKITDFIRKLNINHHKVILTTRSATLITGQEIETNELDEKQTINFLIEAFKNEIPNYRVEKDIKAFNKNSKLIHNITSGRPLFILQFAILLAQKGSLEETLNIDIKSTDEAKNFLYDRIYDYLSYDAKNMFLAINLLVNKDDLSGLLNNLKFILNKEDHEEDFENALNELIKLKIIELEDKEFFKVYSPEILKVMRVYYENKGADYDAAITNRYTQIINNEKLETDYALLKVADSNRLISSNVDVENQYRRIIKRENALFEVRVKALLNFANYLFSHRDNINKTLKLFNDYCHWFNKNPEFIIMHSRYSWAEGSRDNKYRATEILKDYLSNSPKIDEEAYLEIIGTLMVYSTNIVVSERELLKEQKRFNEINTWEHDVKSKEQRERFYELFKYPGSRLHELVKDKNLMNLSSKCRNFVLDGLTSFCEICIRVNKRELATAVCNKVISEMPTDYHNSFKNKLNKIDAIENDGKKRNRFNGDSDLALKLKEALEK